MAKTQGLDASDLAVSRQKKNGTPQRGAAPAERVVPMQFKMPVTFAREFKGTAGSLGLKMNTLLLESFQCWKEKNKT